MDSPVDREFAGFGCGLDGFAFGFDYLAEKLAGERNLGSTPDVLGGLVEGATSAVEPTSHLTHTQTEGVFGAIQPAIQGVATANASLGVTTAGKGDSTVDGEDGVLIRPLVLQRLFGRRMPWRGEKPLVRRRFGAAQRFDK